MRDEKSSVHKQKLSDSEESSRNELGSSKQIGGHGAGTERWVEITEIDLNAEQPDPLSLYVLCYLCFSF